MRYDDGEDHRLKMCPCCRCHVGTAGLFYVRGQLLCEGCGKDEIQRWNDLVRKEDRWD